MINFFYKAVMSHEVIYSLKYGEINVDWETTEDQIITIKTEELGWLKSKDQFIYSWGYPNWPERHFNLYTLENYGKAWAFSKEELVEFWNKEKAGR